MVLEYDPDKVESICNRTSKGKDNQIKKKKTSEDIASRFKQRPNSGSLTLHNLTKKK